LHQTIAKFHTISIEYQRQVLHADWLFTIRGHWAWTKLR